MSHFQNKNKVWINNTLKSNSETLGIIKLLKDIGVFREKAKRRKPKKPAKEEDDEEFLVPPTGGGGGGASVGLLPSSNITQALQALKSGVSTQAQQQYLLENTKEQAQLALGRLRDEQQDYSTRQERSGFGFQPSAPLITFEGEPVEEYFPPKESVVSEPSQEFRQETGGTDIPQSVMDVDVSAKVGEQGQFEDEEQEAFTPVIVPEPQVQAQPDRPFQELYEELKIQYDLADLTEKPKVDEVKKEILSAYEKFTGAVVDKKFLAGKKKDELVAIYKKLIRAKIKNRPLDVNIIFA